MGNLFCCIPFQKKIASRDYFETFVFGQTAIHQIVRRSVDKCSKAPTSNLSKDDESLWLTYIDYTCRFLLIHHQQEDDHIFPFLRNKIGDPNFMKVEGEEHCELHKCLEEIDLAVKEKNLVNANIKMQVLYKMFCENVDTNHLAREEHAMTDALYRTHFSEQQVKDLNTDIHVAIEKHMDRMEALVFMIYHLNDEEKMFFDERLPCIVTKSKFPKKANEKAALWRLTPFPRELNGSMVYCGVHVDHNSVHPSNSSKRPPS